MPRFNFGKSEFARNVLTLVTGTTLAQALPVLISPLLTRLYLPEAFGFFSLYTSLAAIVSVAATCRYEAAIMLPDKMKDTLNITALSMLVTVLISALSFVAVVFLNHSLAALLGSPAIAQWLYAIPLSVFFVGGFQSLSFWFNRQKAYPVMAASKVCQSATTSAGQLLFSMLGGGGLIGGWVLGQCAGMGWLSWRAWKRDRPWIRHIRLRKMGELARRYQNFPRYDLAGAFINSLSYSLVNILISVFFGAKILGFYALVFRVLSMPTIIVGNAVTQVYFERALQEKRETQNAAMTFRTTLKKLLIWGAPIFAALFVGVRYLFVPVFGEDWAAASLYGQILLPFVFIRFISGTLSATMIVFERLRQALGIHLLIISGNLLAFAAAFLLRLGFRDFLYLYTTILSLLYALFLLYFYRLSLGSQTGTGKDIAGV